MKNIFCVISFLLMIYSAVAQVYRPNYFDTNTQSNAERDMTNSAAFNDRVSQSIGSAIISSNYEFNVKQYGATGNGTTVDYLAIQNVINIVRTNKYGGKIVLPEGTYLITNELLLDFTNLSGSGSFYLVGSGNHSTTILQNFAGANAFHVRSFSPVVIKDIGFYSNTTKTQGAAIYIEGPTNDVTKANVNSLIDNCWFGAQLTAIHFAEAYEWTVRSCDMNDIIGTGIECENTVNSDQGDSSIIGCYLAGRTASTNGIYIHNASGIKISSTKINGGFTNGISIFGSSANDGLVQITGCSIENCQTFGIKLSTNGVSGSLILNSTITGNQFYNNFRDVSTSGDCRGLTVSGNMFQLTGSEIPITSDNCVGLTVVGNVVRGSSTASAAFTFGGTTSGICDDNNIVFASITNVIFNVSSGMNAVFYGSNSPSGGTWRIGDRMINMNPSEAGSALSKYTIHGWICTAAGAPGTWLQQRTLTGN